MKKKTLHAAAFAALLAASAASADSMRCGTKLLTDGDPLDKVAALCGEPAAIERREILRPYGYHRGVLINSPGERILRFVPPLIISQGEIDRLLDVLSQIFNRQTTSPH